MKTKKILSTIFSLLFLGAFIFVIIWGVVNFNKVKAGMSGTALYTEEDILNSYQDGCNAAMANKAEYDSLIGECRDTIADLDDNISEMSSKMASLEEDNSNYMSKIDELNEIKADNESTIENLKEQIQRDDEARSNLNLEIDSLENTKLNLESEALSLNNEISNLNSQIDILNEDILSGREDKDALELKVQDLNDEITDLEASEDEKINEIDTLNSTILSLQNLNAQLQLNDTSNLDTIDRLNSEIEYMDLEIAKLSTNMTNALNSISALNSQILQMHRSIDCYEQYIATLESETEVLATFEFDGSIYNIQIIPRGGHVLVDPPFSSDYITFNYWMVDGKEVDIQSYGVETSTRFVANITYKHLVKFMSDDDVIASEIIAEDMSPILPTNPTKEGYEFLGWSLNGSDVVDVENYHTLSDITFTAKFVKLYTVTFIYDGSINSTQSVREGGYATYVPIKNTTYKIFNGWTFENKVIDVTKKEITRDTIFIADLTYSYDVTFMLCDDIYSTQVVIKDTFATLPTNPTKEGYEFLGWSSDGEHIVDIETYVIRGNTTFTAKLSRLCVVKFIYEENILDLQYVKKGERATYVEAGESIYKTFNGWKLGDNIINIESYDIYEDTNFTADITYRYDVKFMVKLEEYDTQIVVKGECASRPDDPECTDHDVFEGWALEGTYDIVDLSSVPIMANTNFVAIIDIKYTVTFALNLNSIISEKKILEGEVIGEAPTVSVPERCVFQCWMDPRTLIAVDPATYVVTEDIVLYARFEQVIFDISFVDGDTTLCTYTVNRGQTIPRVPSPLNGHGKNFKFLGWTRAADCGRIYTPTFILNCACSSDDMYIARYEYMSAGIFISRKDYRYSLEIYQSRDYEVSFGRFVALPVIAEGHANEDFTEVTAEKDGYSYKLVYNARNDTWECSWLRLENDEWTEYKEDEYRRSQYYVEGWPVPVGNVIS